MVSKQPRKQRKALYRAKMHELQDMLSAHLSETLRNRYRKRSLGLKKGDTVEVLRGDFAGHKGKVERVLLKRQRVNISGASIKRTDGTDRYYPIHPSNVVITKIDTSDDKRMRKLKGAKK